MADSTPPDFRFAVKVPRAITHDLQLQDARERSSRFLAETDGLADKRGPLLVQLPPSLAFDGSWLPVSGSACDGLRRGRSSASRAMRRGFRREVTALLDRYRVARVAADPPPVPDAALRRLARRGYFRLHGSPRTYWSRYDEHDIAALAATVGTLCRGRDVWCVFDNTASGAAIENAWELRERLIVDFLPD